MFNPLPMKEQSKNIILTLTAISCFIATLGDFAVMGYAGSIYPGYRMLHDTESMLGASSSPVSEMTSAWWIILGLLFVIFGAGFRKAYHDGGRAAQIASWLIILYGVGEGMGSGIFHADYVDGYLTLPGKIHDALGGLGIAGMFILPLLVRKIIPRKKHPVLHSLAVPTIIIGLAVLILFSIAKLKSQPSEFITTWKGLWQRLLTLNFYVYLAFLAGVMLKDIGSRTKEREFSTLTK